MKKLRGMMFSTILATSMSLAGCGGLIDALEEAADEAARDLALTGFANGAVGPLMEQTFSAVGQAIEAAATPATTPAGAAGFSPSDDSWTLDKTVTVDGGGSLVVSGTASMTAATDTTTMTIDASVVWTNVGAEGAMSSGNETIKGSLTEGPGENEGSGTVDIAGKVKVEDYEFNFT